MSVVSQPATSLEVEFPHNEILPHAGMRDKGSLLYRSFCGPTTPLDRLAAALFCGSVEPRNRLMAMFTAYFDASGNARQQPYVIVAGYIANFGQWSAFDEVWRNTHRLFSVDLPFHMADFAAACSQPNYKYQKNARQDYIEIAKDSTRSAEFVRILSQLVATTVHCGISCIVGMDVYEQVSSVLDLREVLPPYALGARMCLERVRQWAEYFDIEDPVECIFESGDFEQGKFTQLMIDEGQDVPIYKKKIDFPGLQAADQYAWEQYHALVDRDRHQQFQVREVFNFILRAIPKRHTSPSTPFLIRLCERKGIDPQTGFKK
jgi:hypothetical protein